MDKLDSVSGKKVAEAISRAIGNAVNQVFEQSPRDQQRDGKIVEINGGILSVEINKKIYTNVIVLRNVGELRIGDVVKCIIPNNQTSQMYAIGVADGTLTDAVALLSVYPIGAVYISVVSTSPASLFGGTWAQLKDRFLLGAGDIYANGATGGEATHTLTIAEMPAHYHRVRTINTWSNNAIGLNYSTNARGVGAVDQSAGTQSYVQNLVGGSQVLENTGGGGAHSNVPPYLAVYMWKRTA